MLIWCLLKIKICVSHLFVIRGIRCSDNLLWPEQKGSEKFGFCKKILYLCKWYARSVLRQSIQMIHMIQKISETPRVRAHIRTQQLSNIHLYHLYMCIPSVHVACFYDCKDTTFFIENVRFRSFCVLSFDKFFFLLYLCHFGSLCWQNGAFIVLVR